MSQYQKPFVLGLFRKTAMNTFLLIINDSILMSETIDHEYSITGHKSFRCQVYNCFVYKKCIKTFLTTVCTRCRCRYYEHYLVSARIAQWSK